MTYVIQHRKLLFNDQKSTIDGTCEHRQRMGSEQCSLVAEPIVNTRYPEERKTMSIPLPQGNWTDTELKLPRGGCECKWKVGEIIFSMQTQHLDRFGLLLTVEYKSSLLTVFKNIFCINTCITNGKITLTPHNRKRPIKVLQNWNSTVSMFFNYHLFC